MHYSFLVSVIFQFFKKAMTGQYKNDSDLKY